MAARKVWRDCTATYGELKAMREAGLVRESVEHGQVIYEANRSSGYAAALHALVAAPPLRASRTATESEESRNRADAIRTALVAHGAPFWSATSAQMPEVSLEELLARACELARRDPSMARVLPYVVARNYDKLSFDRLERALTEHGQRHAGGFLLALAGQLSGKATLSAWSRRLRDKRRTKVQDFFVDASGARVRRLADRNTPPVGRAWKFRINMSVEDFRSVFQKFHEHVPS